jgi:hypothetical protein
VSVAPVGHGPVKVILSDAVPENSPSPELMLLICPLVMKTHALHAVLRPFTVGLIQSYVPSYLLVALVLLELPNPLQPAQISIRVSARHVSILFLITIVFPLVVGHNPYGQAGTICWGTLTGKSAWGIRSVLLAYDSVAILSRSAQNLIVTVVLFTMHYQVEGS